MAEFELGLFTNPHAPKAASEGDANILWRLPAGAACMDIIPPTHSRWQRFPKRLIVRGGDGSMRGICQWMHDRGEVRPIGLLPGGTQNVLYRVLQELGLQLDIRTFLEKTLDDYPEDQRLKPGLVNEEYVFVNHVGLGRFEQHLGRSNDRLRLLRNRRPMVAAMLSLAAAILYPDGNRELLNLYTISPRIGQVLAFPGQYLLSNALTHAWVEGIMGFTKALVYWQRKKAAPNGILRQFQCPNFADNTRGNSLWLDGDTIPYNLQGSVIKRVSYGIPVVAIT